MSFGFSIGCEVCFYENNIEYFGQIVDRRKLEGGNTYTIHTNQGIKKQCKEENLELYYFDPTTIYVVQFENGKFVEFGRNNTIKRVSLKNADKWHYKWHAEEVAKELSEQLNEKVTFRSVELVLK